MKIQQSLLQLTLLLCFLFGSTMLMAQRPTIVSSTTQVKEQVNTNSSKGNSELLKNDCQEQLERINATLSDYITIRQQIISEGIPTGKQATEAKLEIGITDLKAKRKALPCYEG